MRKFETERAGEIMKEFLNFSNDCGSKMKNFSRYLFQRDHIVLKNILSTTITISE